jgi:hypothetical protein
MKKATSFRLSEQALRMLSEMAANTGVSQTALLELFIRGNHSTYTEPYINRLNVDEDGTIRFNPAALPSASVSKGTTSTIKLKKVRGPFHTD